MSNIIDKVHTFVDNDILILYVGIKEIDSRVSLSKEQAALLYIDIHNFPKLDEEPENIDDMVDWRETQL